MSEAEVRASFAAQAGHCEALGSPFTARLCGLIGQRLDRGTPLGAAVLDWAGRPDPQHDALALRLAGALHGLVLSGEAPALACLYPPHDPGDDAALWAALAGAFERHHGTLVDALRSAPQTNEVRRSALLMAGLAVVASETGLPVELDELGASAGLNLLADRYDCRLGGRHFGTRDATVRLEPTWQGPPPPAAVPHVVARHGVDLNPLLVTRPADRVRLLSFIWADQAERLARTEAAIAIAAEDPPALDAGDAGNWLASRLRMPQAEGVARVVTHTIAVQYFTPATQERIARVLDEAGAHATPSRPLARLGFEIPAAGRRPELWLILWPGGVPRKLAVADPHGAAVEWLGGAE